MPTALASHLHNTNIMSFHYDTYSSNSDSTDDFRKYPKSIEIEPVHRYKHGNMFGLRMKKTRSTQPSCEKYSTVKRRRRRKCKLVDRFKTRQSKRLCFSFSIRRLVTVVVLRFSRSPTFPFDSYSGVLHHSFREWCSRPSPSGFAFHLFLHYRGCPRTTHR